MATQNQYNSIQNAAQNKGSNVFDLSSLYQLVYGFIPVQTPTELVMNTVQGENDFPYTVSPLLSAPLVFPLTFNKGLDNEFQLPIEPMIQIDVVKNIVRTPIAGDDGTVKELIGMQDFRISIRGVLIGDDGNYPEELLRKLRAAFEGDEAKVTCKLLSYFNINQIVMEALRLPALEGYEDMQPFEIEAWSDKDWELILREDALNNL